MPVSRLDILYRKILLSKFFTKGWGDPAHVLRLLKFRKIIGKRETCYNLVNENHKIEILKEETWSDCYVTNGRFLSPLAMHLPEVVHPEIKNAYFQLILPKEWPDPLHKPICIHLAGTGDHYFWKRRQIMVKPLLKKGIASIILENPFYGMRKPKDQSRSCLLNVSDIFVMGGCLILECIALLHWCERLGLGPLGITGLSMGGHMASLAATSWPKPLVLVPCLSWSTASSVFTETPYPINSKTYNCYIEYEPNLDSYRGIQKYVCDCANGNRSVGCCAHIAGVMSESIDWDFLQNQFRSDREFYETLAKLCTIVDDPSEFKLTKEIPEFSLQCTRKSLTPHDLIKILNENRNKSSEHLLVSKESSKPLYNFIKSVYKKINVENKTAIKVRDKDAIWLMRGLMDECTHLKNFATPVDTSLIIAICAKSDAYIPRDGCSRLEDIWPGATIRYLDCGHVGAYIKYLQLFRESILEAFERAKKSQNCSSQN